ncbi:cupredoxin domain-containing protein [Pseudomonas cremoricolorata]|uniref:Copper-binding protein n=1 Tax=Pseudomonas cremoricolorata TaxID=157783 RepID=A0A089WNY6_9PSED|nr:cupredoxin family protein [Pseudomonas cremoricolorata]AIR90286.1 copper-binding protein [Pseudomonas cremoricolorata]
MKSLLLVAAVSALSLPAMAESFAFGEPAPAAEATRTVEVLLKDIAFEPTSLQVKAGETVRFVLINQGQLPHEFNLGTKAMHVEHQKEMLAMQGKIFNAAAAAGGHGGHDGDEVHAHGEGNTVLVQPGQRAELTWTFRGTEAIEFACNVPGHYQAGMVGPLNIE